MRYETASASYDESVTTDDGTLQAWFMRTPYSRFEKGLEFRRDTTFAWHLSAATFRRFRQNPDDDEFQENVLPLEGTVKVRGNEDVVNFLDFNLRSEDDLSVRFSGSVTRKWHLWRVNVVLI